MKPEVLRKSKKDLTNMYGAGITPEQKGHVDWASSKLPNENWSLWATRAHRADPKQFTPEVKEKIEHFAGSQHMPEVSKLRFEKNHDLTTGLSMLEGAEGSYNKRISSNMNVVKPDSSTTKIADAGKGMAWYSLGRGSCSAEGKAMGHCGNVPSEKPGDRVLSLRTEHKGPDGTVLHEPHATFIVNGGYLGEMKGRGNTKPSEKYHEAVGTLLSHPKIKGMVGGGYLHHQNFNINDLEPSQREKVLKDKPGISVYDNDKVPRDLPEKFKSEVKPVIEFRNKLKEEHGEQWRDHAVQEISNGNAPRMALNAITNPTDDELHQVITSKNAPHDTRVQAAMSGKNTAKLHGALATHHPDDLRYLNNPNIDAILNSGNHKAVENLTGNDSLSEKDIDKVMAHPAAGGFSNEAKSNLINQENLSPKYHEAFVNDASPYVRSNIATHKNLDPKFHEQLANDKDEEVRKRFAEYGNPAPEIQQKLFDKGHAVDLTDNKNLAPEVSEKIAQYAADNYREKNDKIREIRENLASNPKTSGKALDTLSNSLNMSDTSTSRIYNHDNLPKETFDRMVDRHGSDPEAFREHSGQILSNPHLSNDQFKSLKTKYGRQNAFSNDFKDHPMYEAKPSEIEPNARPKMLANHMDKLKESNPEKHRIAQEKLINQATEDGSLESAKNLINSGALDDEHHAKLHDTLNDIDEGNHEHSTRQSWDKDDYHDMLKDKLSQGHHPKSYHNEFLNRLDNGGVDSDDIADHVYGQNRDDYSEGVSDRSDEIARENYPYSEHLDNLDREGRNSQHPLDYHIENARGGSGSSYSKSDLSGLEDMADERAEQQLRDSGKLKPNETVEDSPTVSGDDWHGASSDAKDSVHSDLRDYLENGGNDHKFPEKMKPELEKYREHVQENYDEASRDDNDAYNQADDEVKDKMRSDPTMWPKHLKDTDYVKNNYAPEKSDDDFDAKEEEPSEDGMDEFGVKKSESSEPLSSETLSKAMAILETLKSFAVKK